MRTTARKVELMAERTLRRTGEAVRNHGARGAARPAWP
jgi:hypothetical protein